MTASDDRGPPARAERAARLLVRLAAPLVPAARREAWREEWASEIWHHVRRGGGAGPLLVRCVGAFPHALWLRREEVGMDSVLQDVRFALRTLLRRPLFALVVVGTLALGIGGNTAVFSVVDGVLLRPLPFRNSDRLVWIWGREFNGTPTASVSAPDFLEYAAGAPAFEELAAYSSFAERSAYQGGDRPIEVTSRLVSPNLLAALGEEPALGRSFTEEESAGATVQVVMLSHGLWGRLFGFDEAVLGSTLRLGSDAYTVVGVLPEGLDFPVGADTWLPLTFGAEMYQSRSAHFLRPIGLLREGVSLEEARRELDAVAARAEAAYPETNTDWYPIAQDLLSVLVGPVRSALLLLLAAIAAVLLIACANVAGLLLTRSVGRRGEAAVRRALGASRGRLVRQLMTESLLLALAGGAAGLLVGRLGLSALRSMRLAAIPRLDEVGLDVTVLLFTLAVALTVGVLFGLAPAWALAVDDGTSGLQDAGRGRVGGGGGARNVLVVGEVALSFVLVVAAGLMARSFAGLRAVDPGFDPRGVLAVELSFESDSEPAERVAALDAVLDRLRASPEVRAVGAASVLPFSGLGGDTYVYAEERPPEQIRNIENTALIRHVDAGYFATLDVPVRSGRVFDAGDDLAAAPVVVINETLAARLFAGESPIGKRMVVALDSMTALDVVGVVGDVRQFDLARSPQPEFFLSTRQLPPGGLSIVARGTSGTPSAAGVRAAIWDVDPTQPLTRATTLDEMVSGTLAPDGLQALLLGLFSALALGLAAIGIYGVLAEGVSARRREIGIRIAMGARASEVVAQVVRRGLFLAGAGVLVGGVVALAATRLLSALLFGVGPRDPVTFVATPIVLLAVVLLASWLPAAQAARVDPVRALRSD